MITECSHCGKRMARSKSAPKVTYCSTECLVESATTKQQARPERQDMQVVDTTKATF